MEHHMRRQTAEGSDPIGKAPGLTDIEEKLAHLEKTVDDLSDVVARQQTELAIMARRVQLLMEREAERESMAGAGVQLADQKPPHW